MRDFSAVESLSFFVLGSRSLVFIAFVAVEKESDSVKSNFFSLGRLLPIRWLFGESCLNDSRTDDFGLNLDSGGS